MKIPDGFPMEAAGPVFCAGITMYSPLVNWKVWSLVISQFGDNLLVGQSGWDEGWNCWNRWTWPDGG